MKTMLVCIFGLLALLALVAPVFAILGDINGDGKVDITDVAIVARHFGTTPSSPNWDPACDLDGSGKVDISDVAIVAMNFGKHQ
jgi:hypothetical protein